MNEQALRQRLSDRATLVIGNVRQTVPKICLRSAQYPPVGFIAVDVKPLLSAVDHCRYFCFLESECSKGANIFR